MSNDGLFELLGPLERIVKRGEPAAGSPADAPPADAAQARAGDSLPAAIRSRERARWAAFSQISELLTSTHIDFDSVLRAILDLVIKNTSAERGLLIIRGRDEVGGAPGDSGVTLPEGAAVNVQIARNDREEPLDAAAIEYSRSVVRKTLAERRAVIVPDQPALVSLSESAAGLGLRSAMCVPLIVAASARLRGALGERRRHPPAGDSSVIGAIYVDSALTSCAYHPDDLAFLTALANQATATILSARLYHQATTEPLSRLHTRWHFQRLLAEAELRAASQRIPYSLLLVDLDGFKRVNDARGHLAGDQVIREMGDVLRSTTRAHDSAFRYGGEEFAVILADTDESGAAIAAEKVRAAVAARRFTDHSLSVTASIGWTTSPPGPHDPQEIVKRADQALYLAKSSGKNRAERWTEAVGAAARRKDKLAGIVTGDFAADYNNIAKLIEAVAAIGSASDIGELLPLAVDKVIEAVGAERGAVMFADASRDARGSVPLTTIVARDRTGHDVTATARFSRTIPERVMETGVSVALEDAIDPLVAGPATRSVTELALRTILCVPLMTRDRSLGVIYVDSRARAGELKQSSLPLFEALARQVAFAVENARLKAQLAYHSGGVSVVAAGGETAAGPSRRSPDEAGGPA